jgi:hypothetical protein
MRLAPNLSFWANAQKPRFQENNSLYINSLRSGFGQRAQNREFQELKTALLRRLAGESAQCRILFPKARSLH